VRMQVPAAFEYEVAGSVDEAISLLRRHGPESRLPAGGHSLIPMMKLRLASPEVLIDIHKLDGELRYVRADDGVLRVGALARHRDLLESPVVQERYTLLADAEKFIADPLVRNMGTVGGSFAHADPSEDLPEDCEALCLLLGDQPGVLPEVIDRALSEWSRERSWVVVCSYKGEHGHPFVFAREAFGELEGLHGDKAVWKLIEAYPDRVRKVEIDAELPPDVDTPEDYERALIHWREAS
jgi:2-phospho-L-lactate guanylyltransferase (CobY/MobA/RfbA family)